MISTNTQVFNEEEISLFLRQPPPISPLTNKILKGLAVAGITCAFSFFAVNYHALMRVYTTPVQQVQAQTSSTQQATPVATATPTPAIPTIPENTLDYAALSIAAPISWDVAFEESIIQEELKAGITHLAGSAKPGQQGTVVITGHSSNYPWISSAYNTIFAPLLKGTPGQEILINYQNKEFTYKVTKVYEVKPDNLSVLAAGETPGLRLITCTPLGTSLRRLIIEAEQVTPKPANNTPFTHSNFANQVPAIR